MIAEIIAILLLIVFVFVDLILIGSFVGKMLAKMRKEQTRDGGTND